MRTSFSRRPVACNGLSQQERWRVLHAGSGDSQVRFARQLFARHLRNSAQGQSTITEKRMKSRFSLPATLAALALVASAASAQQPRLVVNGAAYHVAHTYQLGGEGGWDYIVADPVQHRLYISRGTHVM